MRSTNRRTCIEESNFYAVVISRINNRSGPILKGEIYFHLVKLIFFENGDAKADLFAKSFSPNETALRDLAIFLHRPNHYQFENQRLPSGTDPLKVVVRFFRLCNIVITTIERSRLLKIHLYHCSSEPAILCPSNVKYGSSKLVNFESD